MRGSSTAMNQRSLWGWSCGQGSPKAGRAQRYGSRWKGIPRALKPREESLISNNIKPN